MELFLVSILAGMLTVLTPCVLPVLPVVLGGSLSGSSKWRPFVISFSLVVSIFLFTIFLKASTVLIDIPPKFWTTFSGLIVLIFGLTLLFPNTWSAIAQKLGFTKSEGLLQKAAGQEGWKGMILLGMALGPVFASCSPTYALILVVVLPQHFVMGLWSLVAYCFGLLIPLLLIGYGGRKILGGFRWFADPTSWFRKGLGILLIVVGVLVLTGYEKKIEAAILDNGFIDFTKVEQNLLEKFGTFEDMDEEIREGDDAEELSLEDPIEALLNVNYPAPELVDPQNWINSETLNLAQLAQEDKVVVIDFWTYSCINCIRTLPSLRALHEKYADQGLVILGVHTPEFAFEHKLTNLEREVRNFALEYPVVQDNDYKTWRAYNNRFWPAKYIIDKNGQVRYTHFGEGAYEETEQVIQYLLSQG
jgi:cytochrome c biogenesis protein CcdA/thiol-disulfide isomerase/thioredoxin